MELYPQLIEHYCAQNGKPVTISFSISQIEPALTFTLGENAYDGSRREFLDFQQISDILYVNEIIGENCLVREELDFLRKELSSGKGDQFNRIQNVQSLIYDTLAKYIIQMLCGSNIPEILFPELTPLPIHKGVFFRYEEE